MNNKITLAIGGVFVIVLGFFLLSKMQNLQAPTREAGISDEAVMSDEEEMEKSMDETNSSPVVDYSQEALTMATNEGKRVVLFFHANWCPTCKAAMADFEANASQIPTDVAILKVDYDTETELKQRYGVAAQDTFVQIDSSGEMVIRWNSGGQGVQTLLSNIQ